MADLRGVGPRHGREPPDVRGPGRSLLGPPDREVDPPEPIVVHGVTVPPGAVYWELGLVKAGSAFNLDYAFKVPVGLASTVSYAGSAATADSVLGTAAVSPPIAFDVLSVPKPKIEKHICCDRTKACSGAEIRGLVRVAQQRFLSAQ